MFLGSPIFLNKILTLLGPLNSMDELDNADMLVAQGWVLLLLFSSSLRGKHNQR
jgi:hypothetical protein